MAVRYVRVQSVSNLFAPATRGTGNIAIIGVAEKGTQDVPIPCTSAADAANTFANDPNADPSTFPDLVKAIQIAFRQVPGPPLVWGIRAPAAGNIAAALTAASTVDAQFVVVANAPLTDGAGAVNQAITDLATHVKTVSQGGEDGKERMGVAMLAAGSTNVAAVTGAPSLVTDRMIYIAHKSNEDVAAAVAGVIAGYEPHVSPLLKKVDVDVPPNTPGFTAAEISTINGGAEDFGAGPKATNGVNWLVDPVLIPGGGLYLGEAYTGDPAGGRAYIDIVRTIDFISFRLKATMIRAIGTVRISRAGLRAVIAQMEAVLDPLARTEVIDRYQIHIPLLVLLDKDPLTLTDAETLQIRTARAQRVVQVEVAIVYAGAIHRLAIRLNFV
jgi:hypothetical protein